ncbi:PREDICTED: uncharacterized protein LOC108781711 [Cyphomyrmex costatus]|uniref:RING-type E3 ubiquitin transferase n=1 Tax=Cyphomyrmex costatus TaxID=456900 RepID=A0A151I779_9HYME|nr:PREDICTED: uncharacterized protein LOC108781711 [Cyphomyrmex costatus]KYM93973.1 hypothetical protein ALC62_15418 [Cyphomyrmex costatus]
MYLKRTSKLLDLTVSRTTADVHLRDLTCPICRGILIEPVTLPCTHNLCLRCLQGTFQHNSLTCPLCRVRVGSWLRTATKSETLVNHGLWQLIRSKFPKEVENKHNGEEGDLGLDADYTANRILSAAGEIHREYKAQLQMAQEEMRRERQAEQIASAALIQKIQAEDQLLFAHLAQDQLLAKTLAKQQKEATKCYNECLTTSVSNYVYNESKLNCNTIRVNNTEAPRTETACLEGRHMGLPESVKDHSKTRQMNVLLSKMYSNVCSSKEINVSSMHKNLPTYCCQKQLPVYNAIAKKHQTVSKFTQPSTSNYSTDPGCSTSKVYVTETKEELRIPSDVVNNKKKSLGVEVCMTLTDDDERIGSAESSGSHDSINQEIHHFKPIKTAPRTKLQISSDGKQIDPKLIRVIPILKKASNAEPTAPSLTHIKRIGCSWSAFKGKIKQDVKEKHAAHNLKDNTTGTLIDQKPSTSFVHSQTISNKPTTKPQTNDAIRRLDFIPESSFDSNKNYTKNSNKIINGTKVSKKSDDEEWDARKTRKSWRPVMQNGMVAKSNRYKNLRSSRKETRLTVNVIEEEDDPTSSNPSFNKTSSQDNKRDGDDNVAVENIAERIKRRKENAEIKISESEMESSVSKRSRTTTKKKAILERIDEDQATFSTSQDSTETDENFTGRTKRRKMSKRKSARNSTRTSSTADESDGNKSNSKFNYDSPPESCDEIECVSESERPMDKFLDKELIEEQQRIERMLLQERADFELARRLQAEYDEMEQIAGRTRRSRRTIEGERSVNVNAREINVTRTVRRTSGVRKAVKRNSVVGTATKGKRGRSKRIKISVDGREDETRTR